LSADLNFNKYKKMSELNTKTVLQSRMECFTKWIAPDPDKKKEIFAKADEIRQYIKQTAIDDGLVVKSMPIAGSSAKGNGLRRHYRGHSEVDGWDIDIPIVVKKDDGTDLLGSLLDKFEEYARKSYPTTKIEKTKSSVKLHFSKKGSFDLVPMLATDKAEEQILVRRDGERISTSVQKLMSL
jgi:tRNA nucleotidyltransferase (CCA-adding enzyme)